MEEHLKTLVQQGLSAQHAGGEVAAKATQDIIDDAKDPALKAALQQGTERSKTWQTRIEAALDQVGGNQGPHENEILEAHFSVSKKIRAQATDDRSRDLGIVAAGQLALHYWIAAFGTMRAYLETLGLNDATQHMQACLDEAKQADEGHNQIAAKLLQAA